MARLWLRATHEAQIAKLDYWPATRLADTGTVCADCNYQLGIANSITVEREWAFRFVICCATDISVVSPGHAFAEGLSTTCQFAHFLLTIAHTVIRWTAKNSLGAAFGRRDVDASDR